MWQRRGQGEKAPHCCSTVLCEFSVTCGISDMPEEWTGRHNSCYVLVLCVTAFRSQKTNRENVNICHKHLPTTISSFCFPRQTTVHSLKPHIIIFLELWLWHIEGFTVQIFSKSWGQTLSRCYQIKAASDLHCTSKPSR